MLLTPDIKKIVQVSENNNLRDSIVSNDVLLKIDEIKKQFEQISLQDRIHRGIDNNILNQIRILEERRERGDVNLEIIHDSNIDDKQIDAWKIINVQGSEYIWNNLFNIWNQYIYDIADNDEEEGVLYKIEEKLESEWNFKLKWIWEDKEDRLLFWTTFYSLVPWGTDTYEELWELDWSESFQIDDLILLWKKDYKVKKEYKESWIFVLEKDWKYYVYSNNRKSLNNPIEINRKHLFNENHYKNEDYPYPDDLVLLEWLHTIGTITIFNLSSWYEIKEYPKWLEALDNNNVYYEDYWLLHWKSFRKLASEKESKKINYFNSSITWKYLWEWELLEEWDNLVIDYWKYEDILNNSWIKISVLLIEEWIRVIFTRDDWEQEIEFIDNIDFKEEINLNKGNLQVNIARLTGFSKDTIWDNSHITFNVLINKKILLVKYKKSLSERIIAFTKK